MGGITEMVITKADVLSGFEQVKAATAYTFEGGPVDIHSDTLTSRVLREAHVSYRAFKGWKRGSLSNARTFKDFPPEFLDFLHGIVQALSPHNVPVTMVGTGPGREEIVLR